MNEIGKVIRNFTGSAIFVLAVAQMTACGKKEDDKTGTVTLKVKSVAGTGLNVSADPKPLQLTIAAAGNLSFTPTVLKLWIDKLVLQNGAGASNEFYTCTTSAADCEVDFADAASVKALEAKLAAVKITEGSYTKVWISCNADGGSTGYIKFKGSAALAAGTKYTSTPGSNGGNPVTTDSSKNGEIKSTMTGACGTTMTLSKTLDVVKDSTTTVTMFANIADMAFYGANTSGGMGGCTIASGQVSGAGFCINLPSVFPYFGETTPTVEMFKVANHESDATNLKVTQANVLVKIIKSSDGVPFWAAFANYYSETTPTYGTSPDGFSGYANSVTTFLVNADKTLTIKSADYGFAAFTRSAHSGDVVGEKVVAGAGTGVGTTYKYKAFVY